MVNHEARLRQEFKKKIELEQAWCGGGGMEEEGD